MKLIITTQVFENYAAWDWSDEGQSGPCPQRWKAKGGEDYEVATLTPKQAKDAAHVCALVEKARAKVTRNDNYFRECLIGYDIVADDYLTDFERDQLKYEGRIRYRRAVLALD